MDQAIETLPEYQTNEAGHLAWDVSLSIRAACLAGRVFQDARYHELALKWADRLCVSTDEYRQVQDWRGASQPVWSAGCRYTASVARIETGTTSNYAIQAVGNRIEIERNHESTVVIHVFGADGDKWSSPEASLDADSPDFLPKLLARATSKHAILLRGPSQPQDLRNLQPGSYPLRSQRAAHLVHTGMIARSLLAAAGATKSLDGTDSQWRMKANRLRSAAHRAIKVHDPDKYQSAGYAWYRLPRDFPSRRLGMDLPHNQVVDIATCFMLLSNCPGSRCFYFEGESLTHRFINELRADVGGPVRPWSYYPQNSDSFTGVVRHSPWEEQTVTGVPREEDSSHATMRVRALADWKAIGGTMIPDALVRTAAKSLRHFYRTSGPGNIPRLTQFPKDVDGGMCLPQVNYYPGAWGTLAQWCPGLIGDLNRLAFHHPPGRAYGATILSAAELVAMNLQRH